MALLLGEDGKSVRAFEPRIDSTFVELFVVPGSSPLLLQDGQGNTWDWSGMATSGPLGGTEARAAAGDQGLLVRLEDVSSGDFGLQSGTPMTAERRKGGKAEA